MAWALMLSFVALTIWVGGHWRPGGQFTPDQAGGELLDLIRLTNRQWENLLDPAPCPDDPATHEERLLKRESIILQLRDMETALAGSGSQIAVVDDLQKWLEGRIDDVAGCPVQEYLRNLLNWISPYAAQEPPCVLQRLSLHPDSKSRFPSLAFELAGEPADMGRSVMTFENSLPAWRLNEMDLYRPEDKGSWWMRGSMSFINEGLSE
jgi:hypothetical protein